MENQNEILYSLLQEIKRDISEIKILIPGKANDDPVNDLGPIEMAMQITNLAKPTIYALTSKNEIPFIKKNRKLYFSKKDLLSWLSQGKQKTIQEATDQVNEYMSKNIKKRG
ncbi:MAG: helix-turn-helix domain-containing protein [Bacteroidales bacterium]|jgi:hypothetical protein|nr:helix-turn-helix domain-containing protein [Bacteroidales bacterium]MDD4215174.1 helix-turn-helix domain-containing protein [Bacteroidales bacterium]